MDADALTLGRSAIARRDWTAACELYARVDPADLPADDLRHLSSAAYLTGDREGAVRALQRSFTLSVAAGDRSGAARDAHWIGVIHSTRGEPSVGAGWVARAHRLLEGEPADALERGYLLIHEMYRCLGSGDLDGALRTCQRIGEIAGRARDVDLATFARASTGRLLFSTGQVAEGLLLLDEAMVALTADEVSPIVAGLVYCVMIEGCQEIGDYPRMSEWTAALTRWCDDQSGLVPFTGQCAVHRGQILSAHGSFAEALDELALAVERYRDDGMDPAQGLATYEQGEVLRIMGDLDGAEAAYDVAASHGHDPQPGRSLLLLAHGRIAPAVASAHRMLDEAHDPVTRSRRLAAAVQILIAGGEADDAQVLADEFLGIAGTFGCDAVTAKASYAAGLVALASDDPGRALTHLRRSWKVWIDLGCRYDAAVARAHIGMALRALGDEASAESDLRVALRTFAELGAHPDRHEVGKLLGGGLPDGLTAREAEVLRLVATGRSNPQIADALFLSQKTVARHLSNIFAKTGVTSRTAATAYAFEHDLT
ncbi:hypothetical protein N801_00440 [Knoellia aerolata DSM 18566]|uniref:HTH luxR-type domain-containing protein n=2 Tax=Knoellia TaxID=136099 RepID=A0A0A0JXS3_9MICO|nr:hypothetical protein N801_00440 [Knoellia aerolata DSM 18566]